MATGTRARSNRVAARLRAVHRPSAPPDPGRIKRTDVLSATLLLTAALGALLEVVLDHAFALPVWIRRVVLGLGVTGGHVRGDADRR